MTDFIAEEPWEAEISSLLGGLEPVEPPPGFIDAALDHRPLGAGRITGALLGAGGLLLGLAAATGVMSGADVKPELAALTAQHEVAASTGLNGTLTTTPDLDLPAGLDYQGTVDSGDDGSQSLYDAAGQAVSVFAQQGEVDSTDLSANGLTEVEGGEAWVSDDVVVVQSENSAVTIIGLPDEALDDVLAALSGGGGAVNRLADVVGTIVSQLGFEDPR